MAETITLTVLGKPEPRGSKVAIPLYDKLPGGKMRPRLDGNGRVIMFPKDDNPRSKPWMKRIAALAERIHGKLLLSGPIELNLHFYLERPQYHFGTGRNAGVIKERYINAEHTVKPDRLKLARAVEDALTAVLYCDDAQTIGGDVRKSYCAPNTQPRVEIEIRQLNSPAKNIPNSIPPAQKELTRAHL